MVFAAGAAALASDSTLATDAVKTFQTFAIFTLGFLLRPLSGAILKLKQGQVQGFVKDNVAVFRALPYAL